MPEPFTYECLDDAASMDFLLREIRANTSPCLLGASQRMI